MYRYDVAAHPGQFRHGGRMAAMQHTAQPLGHIARSGSSASTLRQPSGLPTTVGHHNRPTFGPEPASADFKLLAHRFQLHLVQLS